MNSEGSPGTAPVTRGQKDANSSDALGDADRERLLRTAKAFLDGGDSQPEHVLEWHSALEIAEPVVAARLVRELATRFLRTKKEMTDRVVDRLWNACKQDDAFALARRILGRRVNKWKQISKQEGYGAPSVRKLRQQWALCTSKDPDLSAAMRHDWALEILQPDEDDDPETQGIAGGIWKRRWEWDGSRASLEASLRHYRRGMAKDILAEDGYPAINCAFDLDLLASLTTDENTRDHYEKEATEIRQILIGLKPNNDGKPAALKPTNQWAEATLAQAHLGIAGRHVVGRKVTQPADQLELERAASAMKRYALYKPAPWEVETTLRQLVRLAHLRGISDAELKLVLSAPLGSSKPVSETDPRLASLLVGRVGLALSGGGFRASLYHLGVLARLAESDVLRHVEVLSCVSGGSIVGAHYYLALRKELEEHGDALTRKGYSEVVERVIKAFVEGVRQNVRTRLLANFATGYAIVSGNDRAYAESVSKQLHATFYGSFVHDDAKLHELLVQPKDAPHNFHPGRHNWTRSNKVPVLVLNAATLNTGHSWQFTARSMGESPFSIRPEIDSNARLRRPNYRNGIPDRTARLSDAVAASACVPGLFAPMQLNELYPKHQVKLVDGGVFDNQGSASLIEQDCQVVIVSDASGQLAMEPVAKGGHVAPLLRSFNVFQERVRQSGFDGLVERREAGQLRALGYVHLTQGLRPSALDWAKCEDPIESNDQLPPDATMGPGTGYGVGKDIQGYLAAMRTDLDVFSEIECAALMASGYLAMDPQLGTIFRRVPALSVDRIERDWFFSPILRLVGGRDSYPKAFETLEEHLKASSSGIGRSAKLNRGIRLALGAFLAVVVVVVAALAWRYREAPLLTVGGLALLGVGLLLKTVFGDWAELLLDPRRALRVPMTNLIGATVLWLFAKVVLYGVDPGYLKRGTLSKLNFEES